MHNEWVDDVKMGHEQLLVNNDRKHDTALLFDRSFTVKETFEKTFSLVAVLRRGRENFVVSSAHLPSWSSNDEYTKAVEELRGDIRQAKSKWRAKSVFVGMDANLEFNENSVDEQFVGSNVKEADEISEKHVELLSMASGLGLKFLNTFVPSSNQCFCEANWNELFRPDSFWTHMSDDGNEKKQMNFVLANREGFAFPVYDIDINSDHRLVIAACPETSNETLSSLKNVDRSKNGVHVHISNPNNWSVTFGMRYPMISVSNSSNMDVNPCAPLLRLRAVCARGARISTPVKSELQQRNWRRHRRRRKSRRPQKRSLPLKGKNKRGGRTSVTSTSTHINHQGNKKMRAFSSRPPEND